MKVIGRVTTKEIISQSGKKVVRPITYDVQAIVQIRGKPAYITTEIYEVHEDFAEYVIIVDLLADKYEEIEDE